MQAEWEAASSDGGPESPRAALQTAAPALEQSSQLLRWPTPAPETPPPPAAIVALPAVTASQPFEGQSCPGASKIVPPRQAEGVYRHVGQGWEARQAGSGYMSAGCW